MDKTAKTTLIVVGAIAAIALSGAVAYALLPDKQAVSTAQTEPLKAKTAKKVARQDDRPWLAEGNQPRVAANQAAQRPAAQPQVHCETNNIAGTVVGGIAGGVIGNQFGGGSGKTLATVGGAAAGAYAGSQYIPLHRTNCR